MAWGVRSSHLSAAFLLCVPTLLVLLATGCGNSTSTTVTGNTAVTVLASSTANDQLVQWNITLTSLTLTNQAGKTVTLFATPQSVEYMHLNGRVEPRTTVSVPQDVYVSASATLSNQDEPVCVAVDTDTGGLYIDGAIGPLPASLSDVTVNLPAPITVNGTSMGLQLNLEVSKSISSVVCAPSAIGAASITPTFNLTPVVIAAQPTNSTNGMATGLHGLIGSVNAGGSGFSVSGADGPTWQVSIGGSTVFQGITGVAQLAAGMPVDMDVAIQQDASLLATRVAVYDTNTADLTVASGPLLSVSAAVPASYTAFSEQLGPLSNFIGPGMPLSYGNAVFQTSAQLTNLQSLPFTASFNATNMVAGQNVFASTHALVISPEPIYVPATTLTLVPQTINGAVSAVSSSGGFTTYTISLAPYDLFPNLAVQQGQTTLLNNPGSVVVYVDANTQLLNTESLAVGGVLRFSGLLFNDNGTLRMDCSQVNDGVAE